VDDADEDEEDADDELFEASGAGADMLQSGAGGADAAAGGVLAARKSVRVVVAGGRWGGWLGDMGLAVLNTAQCPTMYCIHAWAAAHVCAGQSLHSWPVFRSSCCWNLLATEDEHKVVSWQYTACDYSS